MNRMLLARTWVVATALAAVGLLAGLLAAAVLTSKEPQQYVAEATLAMLPSQQVPITQAPGFWEVLSRGQATRTAAIVIADEKWLDAAAVAAGVPKSHLTLEAGAISDTTLITVTMKADSASTAESALDKVVGDAIGPAASAAGPFRLEVVSSPQGSAKSLAPARTQMFGLLGIAGMLVGGGLGLLVSQSAQRRSAGQAGGGISRRAASGGAATNGQARSRGGADVEALKPPTR